MVDLPTYLMNVAQYHATKRSNYCGACMELEEYCSDDAFVYVDESLDDDDGATKGDDIVQEENAAEDDQENEVVREADDVNQGVADGIFSYSF